MYSKLLQITMAFCIIPFCNSIPNIVGDYDELVFTQRSPAIIYYFLQHRMAYINASADQLIAYLAQYWMVLNPSIWVIHKLWSNKSGLGTTIYCRDLFRRLLRYDRDIPPEPFRTQLKFRWPSFSWNLTEDELWEYEYNHYGSCIKITPEDYFAFAMGLLDDYHIGRILEDSRIVPGTKYPLYDILSSITQTLDKHSYIRCLPAENDQEQYLLEVQICFNSRHQLKDCNFPVTDLCDTNKMIIYPGWPRIM